jgi:hypothetical protein
MYRFGTKQKPKWAQLRASAFFVLPAKAGIQDRSLRAVLVDGAAIRGFAPKANKGGHP